jgi:hypothetical protein
MYWFTSPIAIVGPWAVFFIIEYLSLPIYVFAVSIGVLAWVLWVLFVRLKRYSVVRLERRSDKRSFFQRKKDELALMIISALIGAGLGVAGTMLAGQLHKMGGDKSERSEPTSR